MLTCACTHMQMCVLHHAGANQIEKTLAVLLGGWWREHTPHQHTMGKMAAGLTRRGGGGGGGGGGGDTGTAAGSKHRGTARTIVADEGGGTDAGSTGGGVGGGGVDGVGGAAVAAAAVVGAVVGGVYWRTMQAGIPGGDRCVCVCVCVCVRVCVCVCTAVRTAQHATSVARWRTIAAWRW